MINRIVIFLVRKKLGVKRCQEFYFTNQKSNATYWFTRTTLYKCWKGIVSPAGVSLNWLLNNEYEIVRKELP